MSSSYAIDHSPIFEKLPGRRKECQMLLDLLADVSTYSCLAAINKFYVSEIITFIFKGTHLPSSIYIHGNTATGKTATIKVVLESINLAWAHLNCVEFDTPALLASQIGAKLNGQTSYIVQ
jgi:Cdc6-like AAA superfamily ATPase